MGTERRSGEGGRGEERWRRDDTLLVENTFKRAGNEEGTGKSPGATGTKGVPERQ